MPLLATGFVPVFSWGNSHAERRMNQVEWSACCGGALWFRAAAITEARKAKQQKLTRKTLPRKDNRSRTCNPPNIHDETCPLTMASRHIASQNGKTVSRALEQIERGNSPPTKKSSCPGQDWSLDPSHGYGVGAVPRTIPRTRCRGPPPFDVKPYWPCPVRKPEPSTQSGHEAMWAMP